MKQYWPSLQSTADLAKHTVYERYRFWKRDQVDDESIDQWLINLRNQVATCEFDAQEDLMFRDKIVFGVMDEPAKERLLRGELTLQRVMNICHAAESTRRQLDGMKSSNAKPVAVNAIGKSHKMHQGDKGRSQRKRDEKPKKDCKYCGKMHPPRKCGTKKHFATVCQKGAQPSRRKVELLEASIEDRETYLVVETIHISSVQETWEKTLKVRETDITFKLDTGAQANVLPSMQ